MQTTDVSAGGGDQANAVAVQPDGKIVVAGFATHGALSDGDFALVRYEPDGTPDPSFGDHGVVTTDLGTRSDDARAVAIQPDGRIVVAGTAEEDVALARYSADGKLEQSTISDLGSSDVATGVAPARSTRASRTTASSPPTSTARATSGRTSRSTRRAGSSPPATRAPRPAPSSRSCARTRSRVHAHFRRVHAHGLFPKAVVSDRDVAAIDAYLRTLPDTRRGD